MKIYCLSGDPNYPCFVLTAKGCTIMLDCSLNMKTLQHFLPELLVPNPRVENMPNFRTQNGIQIDNAKEFNNRVYLNSTLEFSLPQFDLINIEDLDAVLISNYNTILALPYLTKLKGFRANIYCTEPILHLGRILMEELTHYIKNNESISVKTDENESPDIAGTNHLLKSITNQIESNEKSNEIVSVKVKKNESNGGSGAGGGSSENKIELSNVVSNEISNLKQEETNSWKQNWSTLAQVFNINESHMKPINWKTLYTKEDVDYCLSKMKLVDFNERVSIFGSLVAQPKSSGYSLGSCNWTIEADCDSILYMSRSSGLNSHSKVFNQIFLKQQIVDCLLLTGLNQAAFCEPEQMVQDFCKACIVTIKNQGNVLIPTLPTGKIYDLIECLYRYLADANLSNTPVYFISPLANQSLAYSNIFAEWLCDAKQNLVYAAEYPFQHGELVRSGQLKVYPAINSKFNEEFHQPCIVFASHPSLRFGEACHFIELWKNSPTNSFIFTEPEFCYLDSTGPFQPIYANCYYLPIDTSLNTNQLHKLLKETKQIDQIIVSNHYKPIQVDSHQIIPNDQLSKLDPSRLSPNTTINYYFQNDIIKLELKRKYENCDIEADLAAMIIPVKSNNFKESNNDQNNPTNVAFTTFSAQLITKNNRHVLKAAPRTIPLTRRDRLNEMNLKKYTYGKLNLEKFQNFLRQSGLASFRLIEKDDDSIDREPNDEQKQLDDNNSSSNKFIIEIDKTNKIDIDLNTNQVNVICDNEDIRIKIKESLLKCLNTL